MPYLAILPTLVTFLVLLGYPVALLFATSLQKFGIYELINHVTTWIGLQNYYEVLFREPPGSTGLRHGALPHGRLHAGQRGPDDGPGARWSHFCSSD